MEYIDGELAQLNATHVDLLLFHHRCRTPAETVSVWRAFEIAKRLGKAKHLGVSNFNRHDLATLLASGLEEPIEVLEAHFGVGLMDFEVLEFANAHRIHPVAFASLSQRGTDLTGLHAAVGAVAAAHAISEVQAMYAYVLAYNVTVISSCFHPENPSRCAAYYVQDLATFDVVLSADEIASLDRLTPGKRTCTDCYTDECQACVAALHAVGCPLGVNGWGHTWWHVGDNLTEHPAWGRSNRNGTHCLACAALPQNEHVVLQACGRVDGGESRETMVPKACGI